MRRFLLLFILLFIVFHLRGIAQSYRQQLNWKKDASGMLYYHSEAAGLYFEDALIDPGNGMPLFFSRYKLNKAFDVCYPFLEQQLFEPLTQTEISLLPDGYQPPEAIEFKNVEMSYIRKEPYVAISFIPLRYNPSTGDIEKLISFTVRFEGEVSGLQKSVKSYTDESVLATGDWYKFRTTEKGVYRITYEEMEQAGMALQDLHPSQIKIFGNGNRSLPEQNDLPRPDDLSEIAIQVVSDVPDLFRQGDYVLFYATSPHTWHANLGPLNQGFDHEWNIYTDHSYYFLTIGDTLSQRIPVKQPLNQQGSHKVRTFNDYALYKPDEVNLARIGREWYSKRIAGNSSAGNIPSFHFPNIDTSENMAIRSRYAIKANEMSRVKLFVDQQEFPGTMVLAIPVGHVSLYARTSTINTKLKASKDLIDLDVMYVNSNSSASAWVDFIEINARRHLIYTGGQMHFRDIASVGSNYTGQFILENPEEEIIIWEVTEGHAPENIQYKSIDDHVEFTLRTDVLREFVTFTADEAYDVEMFAQIENQNLHGVQPHDFIIVTPAALLAEAEQFADFRRQTSDLSILVVQVEQIYNEFSSGSVDPTAIRDFMKMLYDRAGNGNEPKYLLLFGDGSYDPKNRLSNNNNLIPAFQSPESLRLDLSFVTDDYYGLLDNGEGLNGGGSIDLGIGRFPVNTSDEALAMLRKVEHYMKNLGDNRGNWQNSVCYVAHDEDKDLHFNQAEELVEYVDTTHRVFNIEKIYLDAYQRVYVPGGYRYPDANNAINEVVENGTMLVNYIGHGGETGWATSQVLTNSDILGWKNLDNMPLFLTATCSFGRFDNPELVSAGELVVKNPDGGGIALFTTSRLAYSSFNFRLNKSFTRFMFQKDENGNYFSFGELVMHSKNDNDNNTYIRNFVLLGDPSLHSIFPEYEVRTTKISGSGNGEDSNVMLGLSEITVSGYIADHRGDTVLNYNGTIYPVVYDKPEKQITLANHSDSTPKPFIVQNSVLYKGKASVSNGLFTFSFVVPRDVNPKIDYGKISYFATNGISEAHGYYDDFTIGGIELNAAVDTTGPSIYMYMNDVSFKPGDYVNDSPILYVDLNDPAGINFFGLGIGHDIVAYLNENTQNPIILNDYFEPVLDSHTKGEIAYQFKNLQEGKYTLHLKAWDVHNNSSEAYTEFYVTPSLAITSGNLLNYPNPFSEGTHFVFNHNYIDQAIDVSIDIYNLAGKLVKTIGPEAVVTSGSTIEPVYWDGRGGNGNRLESGIYIYTISIQAPNNSSSVLRGKLMILH